jgi:branched-chain amino acid transport system permease protein
MTGLQKFLLLVGIVVLLALPLIVSQSLVNASIQMLTAVLFACAFNVLSGQGGLLSFGHAAYFGLGAFATVHAMNALGGKGLLPTPLLPLAGAAMGLITGIVVGWFATKRSGVYFAMVTLALAELLHSLAPHLTSYFGGESGLSTMRLPAWGLSFGTSNQIYYLSLGWVLLSVALLYLFTLTPLGRLTLGVRENANRLRFLGYDVHRLTVFTFAVSTTFTGLAGALQAINMEGANYVVFDSGVSAAAVLNCYIGGVTIFLGPALGAAAMTLFGYAVSDLTRSWLLYQGIVFVAVMLFMPTGIAGLIELWSANRKTYGTRASLPVGGLFVLGAASIAIATIFVVELLQRCFSQDYRSLAALNGGSWPPVTVFGHAWAPLSPLTWLVPLLLIALGVLAARVGKRRWLCVKNALALPHAATASTSARARRNPA